MELILGAGRSTDKLVTVGGVTDWVDPIRLDMNPEVEPDVRFDLDKLTEGYPLPFDDDQFDEIHAYEVLEHIGTQGDFEGFFRQFGEFWRVLKPGGYLCGSVPMPDSLWAWADPGHRRIIALESFFFLNQDEYAQVGHTPMTDYRAWWKGDFVIAWSEVMNVRQLFALQARKP